MINWAGHVARIAKIQIYTGFLFENVEENDRLENIEVERNIIINPILTL
jgi:hypothetical protein